MRALVVAQDPEDRDFHSFVLRRTGLDVSGRETLNDPAESLGNPPVDLIFLTDDGRPTLTQLIETLRTQSQAPIILLADAPNEDTQCAWMDAGVDLVLKRPLSPRILSRYVRMLLRRAGTVPASVLPILQSGDLRLDPTARTVTAADGEEQRLSPLEFRLLYLLMTNRGQVIPVDVIVERVWGYSGAGNRELVRGLVRRLRKRISPHADAPQYIQNVPGVGYRFLAE